MRSGNKCGVRQEKAEGRQKSWRGAEGVGRRAQAQRGHPQPTACSQRKELEAQRPNSLPEAPGLE